MKTLNSTPEWNQVCLVVLLGFTFGGCRFGNFTERPNTTPSAVGVVKTLRTLPTRLETEVYYDDDDVPSVNPNTLLQALPSEVLKIFSNPLGLYIPNPVTATNPALFFNTLTKSSAQATRLSPSNPNVISSSLVTTPTTLWSDPGCQTALQIDQTGSISPPQSGDTVDGNLSLEFTVIRVFTGTCENELRQLSACYVDESRCTNEDERKASVYLFDLYARYAGILDTARTHLLKGLVYTVIFQ